jgi:3-hydroxy acid dehydrogenase / malonic semialdehyde reductase
MSHSSRKLGFITGATSGIGEATAKVLASNGYNLIITGRRASRLSELKLELEKTGAHVLCLCFDVSILEEVNAAINSLEEHWRGIDLLVNNAGLAAGLSTIQEGDLNNWETMIDTNVKGLLYVSKAIMPMMISRKSGHIINIGSIAGKEAYARGNVYCATKHAVDALTKSMRIDLLPHHIRVTSVCPGAVDTEFSLVRFNGDQERAKMTYNGFVPLSADDIADTILWVASRPAHVNINDILIMPTAQANTTHLLREETE